MTLISNQTAASQMAKNLISALNSFLKAVSITAPVPESLEFDF